MAKGNREQHELLFLAALMLLLIGLNCGVFLEPSRNDTGDKRIKYSALLVVIFWPFSAISLISARRTSSRVTSGFRVIYSLGCVACALHIAIAFHLGHGWSHRAAFEHTERASGFGPGIFVNYLFLLVLITDVIWAWVAFDQYLKRPA